MGLSAVLGVLGSDEERVDLALKTSGGYLPTWIKLDSSLVGTAEKNGQEVWITVKVNPTLALGTSGVISGSRILIKGSTIAYGGGPSSGEVQVYAESKVRVVVGSTVMLTIEDGKIAIGPGAAATVPYATVTQSYSTTATTLSAYTTDPETSAYTGIDNAQAATPYAQVSDLNALRVAYENLRASHDNLLGVVNTLINTLQTYGWLG